MLAVVAVFVGGPWFWAVAVLATGTCWWEFVQMARAAERRPWLWLGGLGAGGLCLLAAAPATPLGSWREIGLAAAFALIFVATFFRERHGGALEDAACTLVGVVWIGWLAGYAIVLRDSAGAAWLLTALAITWAADTAAYFTGRAFGRHLLCPRVSPKKTVEGLAGGMAAALLVGALAAVLALHVPWWAGAIVGLAGGLAAVAGDLAESFVKRQFGVKDSGHLVPGHGGLLDRIDSLLFAIPAVTACVMLIRGG